MFFSRAKLERMRQGSQRLRLMEKRRKMRMQGWGCQMRRTKRAAKVLRRRGALQHCPRLRRDPGILVALLTFLVKHMLQDSVGNLKGPYCQKLVLLLIPAVEYLSRTVQNSVCSEFDTKHFSDFSTQSVKFIYSHLKIQIPQSKWNTTGCLKFHITLKFNICPIFKLHTCTNHALRSLDFFLSEQNKAHSTQFCKGL